MTARITQERTKPRTLRRRAIAARIVTPLPAGALPRCSWSSARRTMRCSEPRRQAHRAPTSYIYYSPIVDTACCILRWFGEQRVVNRCGDRAPNFTVPECRRGVGGGGLQDRRRRRPRDGASPRSSDVASAQPLRLESPGQLPPRMAYNKVTAAQPEAMELMAKLAR